MAPKKKGKKDKLRAGDSPVTVGGGGGLLTAFADFVELEFDHCKYLPDPDDQDNFVFEGSQLDYLEINTSPVTNVPLSSSSEITIEYKKGLKTPQITITGVPVGVSFPPKDLRFNHGLKKHRGDGLQLRRVLVDGIAQTLPATPPRTVTVHMKPA